MWEEAVLVTVSCVIFVQMGLVDAIGKVLRYEFKIISCPKCLTFWVSLAVHVIHGRGVLETVTASFLSAYSALWLSLFYDALALLYNKGYEAIEVQTQTPDTDKEKSGSDEVS